ncbi:MAG: DUF3536 domain-containing protein, partial [Candidatus Omnitrophica bacterium]|nr:DUF3536 domain-containing protein [Candidatus Omnitrophota bacterium]
LLERAPSNIVELKNGAKVYEQYVQSSVLDLLRVGVHYAVSSLFKSYEKTALLYAYSIEQHAYEQISVGKQKLATGRIVLFSRITQEQEEISFAALHLGDHNVVCGARDYQGEVSFAKMQEEMKEKFAKGEITELIRLIDASFSSHSFSLWHLFKDEQRQIIEQIAAVANKEVEASFKQIYGNHLATMEFMKGLGIPLPSYFPTVAGVILNKDIQAIFEEESLDITRLEKLSEEARRWAQEIDKEAVGFIATRKIDTLFEGFLQNPTDALGMARIITFLHMVEIFSLELSLWRAQNIYFSVGKQLLPHMREPAAASQEQAKKWLALFNELGDCLKVKVL